MSVYFVTGNNFKFERAKHRLSDYNIDLKRKELDVIEIQSSSLKEIALDKARKSFNKIGEPVVAVDAGLFIKKFNGFPGPYTHYAQNTLGVDGLIELIKKPSKARIQQVVAYKDKNREKTFESGQDGKLLTERRGKGGYFFDFIFQSDLNGKVLAEMSDEERDKAWGDRWDQFGKWFNNL